MAGGTPVVDTCMSWHDPKRNWQWAGDWRCPIQGTGTHCGWGYEAYDKSEAREDFSFLRCGRTPGSGFTDKCYPALDTYPVEPKDKLDCCLGAKQENECHPDYCRKDGKSLGQCQSFLVAHCQNPENLFDATGCVQLKTKDPEIYKYVMKDNCKGDKLKNTQCKEFCRDNPSECQTELLEYCKDKHTNREYEDICACYYQPRVYLDIADEFEREWQVPSQYLDHRPKCSYPQCKTAFIGPPDDNRPCVAQHISSCISNIDIDVNGKAKIGSVILTNDQKCGQVYTKPFTRPATTTEAGSKKDESGSDSGNKSNNGGFLGTGMSTTLGWATIGGGGAVVVFLFFGLMIYFANKRKSTAEKVGEALDRTNLKHGRAIKRPYPSL